MNCSRPYRCIKCPNQHRPGECPLNTIREASEITVKPHCVNCLGEHPANYRGCQSYINYINIKSQRSQAAKAENETRRAAYNNLRQPNVTYAATVNPTQTITKATKPIVQNQSQPENSDNQNVLDFLERECTEQFGVDLATLITKASRFVPTYITLPNEKKSLALIKFALSIAPHNL